MKLPKPPQTLTSRLASSLFAGLLATSTWNTCQPPEPATAAIVQSTMQLALTSSETAPAAVIFPPAADVGFLLAGPAAVATDPAAAEAAKQAEKAEQAEAAAKAARDEAAKFREAREALEKALADKAAAEAAAAEAAQAKAEREAAELEAQKRAEAAIRGAESQAKLAKERAASERAKAAAARARAAKAKAERVGEAGEETAGTRYPPVLSRGAWRALGPPVCAD